MSRRNFLQNHFRQSFESSPESRGSQTSGVLFGSFCTTQKARKTFLSGKLRGFPNLDSAHRNGSFAPQQLKPFKEDSRFCKPRISAHRQQTRTNQIKSFCRPRRLFLPLRGFFRRPRRLFFRLAAVPCCRRNNSLLLRGFIRRQNRRIIVKFS
jgi:hypothetical protein